MDKITMPNAAIMLQRKAIEEIFNFDISVEDSTCNIKNLPFTLIVFDTETSGLDNKKDKIVQISAIKFKCEDGKLEEINRLDQFINQPEYDENKLTKEGGPTFGELTGITNDFLKTQPTEDECFEKIYEFFGENPVLVGHNVPFDYGFLVSMYIRHGKNLLTAETRRFDTLNIARDVIPRDEAPQAPNREGKMAASYRLGLLVEMYGLDKEEDSEEQLTFHNSMSDTIATSRLFQTLIYEYSVRLLKNSVAAAHEPPVVKERVRVTGISFWEGFRGFSRIYVNGFLRGASVSFFYDVRKKEWGEKDAGTMIAADMDLLKSDAFDLAKVPTEEEFAKVKTAITADADFSKRYEEKTE